MAEPTEVEQTEGTTKQVGTKKDNPPFEIHLPHGPESADGMVPGGSGAS